MKSNVALAVRACTVLVFGAGGSRAVKSTAASERHEVTVSGTVFVSSIIVFGAQRQCADLQLLYIGTWPSSLDEDYKPAIPSVRITFPWFERQS